jgi:hypothetical protein
MPGHSYRIKVWYVDDIERSTYYDYQVMLTFRTAYGRLIIPQHQRPESTAPIKHIIPFPKSPSCILWAEYDKLCILSQEGSSAIRTTQQIEHLQALVITPDEKAVIFVTGTTSFRRRSKLSFSHLRNDNGHLSFGNQHDVGKLERPLTNPSRCAIGIRGTNVSGDNVTVLIAHCDGTHESHQVNLRNPGNNV